MNKKQNSNDRLEIQPANIKIIADSVQNFYIKTLQQSLKQKINAKELAKRKEAAEHLITSIPLSEKQREDRRKKLTNDYENKFTTTLRFNNNLINNALFLSWFERSVQFEPNQNIWIPLTTLYHNYEGFMRNIQQIPVSRHNHFAALLEADLTPKKSSLTNPLASDRRRDGFYVNGLILVTFEVELQV